MLAPRTTQRPGVRLGGLLLLAALTACEPQSPPPGDGAKQSTPSSQKKATQNKANQKKGTPKQSPPKDQKPQAPESLDDLTPKQVVERMLERCHGTVRGRSRMLNCVVELGLSADDPEPELVLLGDNDCMRVTRRDGTRATMIGNRAWRITANDGNWTVAPLGAGELRELQKLYRLLQAALLIPLYDTSEARRQGPTVFALELAGGATWRLELSRRKLDDGSQLFFPSTLTGTPGKITFETMLHTGITNLPKKTVLGEIGTRWITLQDVGLVFQPAVFTNPMLAPKKTTQVVVERGGDYPDYGVPERRTKPARVSLVSEDPGDWQELKELLLENGQQLGDAGQEAEDLDFLFDENGKRHVAQPFRMTDPDRGGRPFVAKKGQRILHQPAHEIVLVYPKRGTLAACEKEAHKILDAYVKKHGLKKAGPLRIIPWVYFDRPLEEQNLKRLRVGFELPIVTPK